MLLNAVVERLKRRSKGDSHGSDPVNLAEWVHGTAPWVLLCSSASKVRALCMTWSGSGTRSNSHAVAARGSCTKIPLAAGEGSGGRDHSSSRLFKPSPLSVRPPGSAGTDQVPVNRGRGQRLDQAGLRTAPSIGTPAVAYFQSATSSLRARATIIILPRRPPVRLIRSRNHRVSADCG